MNVDLICQQQLVDVIDRQTDGRTDECWQLTVTVCVVGAGRSLDWSWKVCSRDILHRSSSSKAPSWTPKIFTVSTSVSINL